MHSVIWQCYNSLTNMLFICMNLGKNCRLRWTNQLNPEIKKTRFTREENDALIRAHETYGNKWSLIATFLPGRTDNSIKNQWHFLNSMKCKDVRAYNRHVSVDSANNCSGSTITNLTGKSIVVVVPSPSGILVS